MRATPHDDALAGFSQACERQTRDDAEGILGCAGALSALLGHGVLEGFLAGGLERLLSEPEFVPASVGGALVLARGRRWRLALQVLSPGARPATVEGPAEHLLVGAMGPAPLEVERHTEEPVARDDVFDPGRRLLPEASRTLLRGDVLVLAAGRDVCVPRPTAPTVIVSVSAGPVRPLRWFYDGTTCRAVRAVAGDPTASRLELTAELLAELGGAAAAPTLIQLTEHPAHHVRWSALRALSRVDTGAAQDRLQLAADDPHPHIRTAARRTLARLAESLT
ncbi:HEAT repeat domain-containing protein [Hyalangium gracile]|uniref:HEAT repeat domain-containing protein n=1 Tax=Hyalangium gracile TaxID=394092 RepID=UPI001CCB8547|nr:HEAT repeat domain-containing protein [Hyalangium gracile]